MIVVIFVASSRIFFFFFCFRDRENMIYLGRRIGREVFFVLFSSSRKEGNFIHRGCIIYIYIYIYGREKGQKKRTRRTLISRWEDKTFSSAI